MSVREIHQEDEELGATIRERRSRLEELKPPNIQLRRMPNLISYPCQPSQKGECVGIEVRSKLGFK